MNSDNKNEVVTLSFKLPKVLDQKMSGKIIADGYGMRGKSKWVKEAIQELLQIQDFEELVFFSDEIENINQAISVRVPSGLAYEIEQAIIAVRKKYPKLEGVKSRIIRTAILQRLIRT